MQELQVPDATVFVPRLRVANNTTNTRQCPHLVSLEHSYVPLSYEFHSSPDLNQQSPTVNSKNTIKGFIFIMCRSWSSPQIMSQLTAL